jgi:hypothetical protein
MQDSNSHIPTRAHPAGIPDGTHLDRLDWSPEDAEESECDFAEKALSVEGTDEQSTPVGDDNRLTKAKSADEPAETHRHWNTALGTLVIILTLLAMCLACLLGPYQLGSLDQMSSEGRAFFGLTMRFSIAAAAGAIARWLALAAKGIPDSSYSLVEYLRRWLADTVSTALTVTAVLLVSRSFSIQLGTITVALADASLEMLAGLAFVLGYASGRARWLLEGISNLTILQRAKKGKNTSGHQEE